MSIKYGFFCFLLALVVLLLAIKSYEIWTQPIKWVPEKGETKKSESKTVIIPPIGTEKEKKPIQAYITIAEKNIFSPERKDFPVMVSGGGPGGGPGGAFVKKPIVRPQVVLYGVTLLEDYQSASIVNPGRPLKRGEREILNLKVGEQVGEYKLTKILSDRIILEAEEDNFEVLLYDAKMPKRRSDIKTENRPATVTSTLPAPSPPTGEAPRPAPPREQPVVRPAEPVPERVVPTSPASRPSLSSPPPRVLRRGEVPAGGAPLQGGAPIPVGPIPGAPPQETGGN
jgi:hypothetical protein